MSAILTATILVAVIGLIAALILVIASHFMAVEVNEKEVALRACLPGANCGSCGYTGCDGYAAAMAADPSIPGNLCRPGGADSAEKIAAVLGIEAEAIDPLVAFVHCSGDCESRKTLSDYQGIETCSAAKQLFGGKSGCEYGCLGCGDCANVCPNDAICIENGIAHVDPRACVGCGMCADTCPNKLITLIPVKKQTVVACSSTARGAIVHANCVHGCIGCAMCAKFCEKGAITISNKLAHIDPDKCGGCGDCIPHCSVGAIRLLELVPEA